MLLLYVFLEETPQLRLVHGEGGSSVDRDGSWYHVYSAEHGDMLFYDWLEDADSCLCGIEIHLEASHPAIADLRLKRYVSFDPYPQIHLRPASPCRARGLEAFGDIWLLKAHDGQWLIALGVEQWLTEKDRLVLRTLT